MKKILIMISIVCYLLIASILIYIFVFNYSWYDFDADPDCLKIGPVTVEENMIKFKADYDLFENSAGICVCKAYYKIKDGNMYIKLKAGFLFGKNFFSNFNQYTNEVTIKKNTKKIKNIYLVNKNNESLWKRYK